MDVPGVNVCVAVSRERESGNVVKGFGAHPSIVRAVRRAILECSQMLPNVHEPSGTLRGNLRAPTLQSHLFPSRTLPARALEDYYRPGSDITIRFLVNALEKLGVETLSRDLTRPEVGVPVVRTVAPGLCSWFDRRGHERMYEVPVRLGLRQELLKEEDVNGDRIEDCSGCFYEEEHL
jgi:ribosomal protein S12 methylthiotransferase accessory factor